MLYNKITKNKLNPLAKKILAGIIVILILVIGGFWYIGGQVPTITVKDSGQKIIASTTAAAATSSIYAISDAQIKNLEAILAAAIKKESTVFADVPLKIYPSVYQLSDLKTTSNESTSTLIDYGLAVADALSELGGERDNAAEVMLAALDNKDVMVVTKLSARAKIYQTAEIKLAAMAAPRSAAARHLAILNNINKINRILTDMAKVLDNPEFALKSAGQYQQTLPALYQAFVNFNKYFSDRGIKFNSYDQVTIQLNLQ